VVVCLERGAGCLHMVQLMPLYPQTPSSLASFKSRLVLPFWYRLTQVVLERRPFNGCCTSSSQHSTMLRSAIATLVFSFTLFIMFVLFYGHYVDQRALAGTSS